MKKHLIFGIVFCFFVLYDYYNKSLGGRIFDYFGIFLIICLWVISFNDKNQTAANKKNLIIFYTINILIWTSYAIYGLFKFENYLTFSSFSIGYLLIFPSSIFLFKNRIKYVSRAVNYAIIVNLLFFFFQLIMFKLFNRTIEYHNYLGFSLSRNYNPDLNFFRPSGLYQEPSEYAKGMFFLLTTKFLFEKFKFSFVNALSILSYLLSESFWGLGALALIILNNVSNNRLFKITSLIVFYFFNENFNFILNYFNFLFSDQTLQRFLYFSNDASVVDRLGLESNSFFTVGSLFGNGLTTDLFQATFGANAFSFYIYCFGLVGLLIYVLSFLILKNQKKTFNFLVYMGYLFFAFPHMTYMGFWLWVGLQVLSIEFIDY